MGSLGLALIATFFVSTLVVELSGHVAAIVTTKRLIVYGLFLLIPAMLVTGLSGRAVTGARQGRLIKTKLRRMGFIAANGLLVLTPCAIILDRLAAAGSFETTFYLLQGLELAAGAVNIGLMGLNFRDGLLLAGRLRRRRGEIMK
jgi:hypothetical protein